MTGRRLLGGVLAATLALAPLGAGAALAAPTTPPPSAAATTAAPSPSASGDDADCPHRHVPAPPVDSSEVPAPGSTVPAPLPVPDTPIGGQRLGGCGEVLPGGAPPPPADLGTDAWVIADLDSGQVLAARDPHGRHRPASTIKVLLALVVLDRLDLDTVVTATEADAYAEGSAVGMGPGGRYTVRQLLQGLLMSSGNDAAHALAGRLGGLEAATAAMNETAAALGARDTRTASPSGLDGPGMATSAYDMALIFRAAMADPVFAEYVSSPPVMFPGHPVPEGVEVFAEPDPEDPDAEPEPLTDYPDFWIANDDRLLTEYPGALGGKTGFTDDAGLTYVGAAERDGRRLVVAMLSGEIEDRPFSARAADLLDYGFALPADAEVGVLESAAGAGPQAAPGGLDPAEVRAGAGAPGTGSTGRYVLISATAIGAVVLLWGAARLARRPR